MGNIALQLYSIKELTAVDFLGTLSKVAEIGYDGVEFAGYFDTSAKDLRRALDTLELKAAGSHIGISELEHHLDRTIEYSLEIQSPYVICPGLPEEMRNSADSYKRTAERFNHFGERCKQHGIKFGYHNHDIEFQIFEGEYGLDLLMRHTESDYLFMELDTFWVEHAGLHSIDFIQQYKDRCKILHIKDMKSKEEKTNIEVGSGIIDFNSITTIAKKHNIEWYTIEQEEFDLPQLKSIELSLHYLSGILKP